MSNQCAGILESTTTQCLERVDSLRRDRSVQNNNPETRCPLPRPVIKIELPDVYDQRVLAQAAADGIANLIGDQPSAWQVSLSEAADASGWLVRVNGPDNAWSVVFDGEDQNTKTIVDQFRLNLQPYLRT